MLIFSYNLSPTLSQSLKQAEKLRSQILLTPVSPHHLTQLSWSATLAHLRGWAALANQPLTPQVLENILAGPGNNRPSSPFVRKALNYRQALNHIWHEWTANPTPLTTPDLRRLARILDVSFRKEEEVTSLLGYIQTGSIHPLIQSAIIHLYFYPNRLCYLSSLLILYKYGYDLHRLLTLEDYWSSDKTHYLSTVQSATKLGQITLWLEYFCAAAVSQMSKILTSLSTPLPSKSTSFARLSDRQKAIVALLELPGTSITNQKVQSELHVSQITASRDLAKLSALNLITPHGSGRSTAYTRA